MLDIMRQNANKWFIKILLILVMASFVLWGIVDMVVRSQANQTVARVGQQKVTVEELARGIDHFAQNLQQRKIQGVDNSLIVERSLKDLINAQLVDQELAGLGLVISDTWLREVVRSLPVFQQNGRFDPELFRTLLAQNHLSDVRFLNDLREQLKTQHYTGALLSGTNLPKVYSRYVIQAVQTPYVFATISLSTKQMPEPTNPNAEELQLYYTNNIEHYRRPEQRTVQVLRVDTAKLTENSPVSEAEVQALFNERNATTQPAERRDIQRLTFSTRKAAEKAVKQLNGTVTLQGLSKDYPQAKYEGQTMEQAHAPEAIATILFTLKEYAHTGIIETPSGYSIYQVKAIHAPSLPQLDASMHKQLEQEIRMTRSGDIIKQWLDQLNDALAGGESPTDLAKKFKLETYQSTVVGSGKQADGQWRKGVKETLSEKIGREAFALSEGQTSSLIEGDDNTSVVVNLEKIIPSVTPEFKDVAADVKRDWVNKAKEKMIEEKCRILTKATSLAELNKLAAASGLHVITQKPLSSVQLQSALAAEPDAKKQHDVPSLFLEMDQHTLVSLFALQQGECIVGRHGENEWVVVMLEKCLAAPKSEDKNFETGINASFERDLSALLINALRKKHTVTIDTAVVQQVTDRLQQNR